MADEEHHTDQVEDSHEESHGFQYLQNIVTIFAHHHKSDQNQQDHQSHQSHNHLCQLAYMVTILVTFVNWLPPLCNLSSSSALVFRSRS